ncbi:WD repeat-containing protein 27 [Liparis tanakae]|uniref:WD repeat-containing protein 27 n=1 Tax=Liparis tanakae TaxID=230148 RepID=A0A4Z2HLH5_9TELE|nr:WD repeat-containing protein 27 [Liparis tanakae]
MVFLVSSLFTPCVVLLEVRLGELRRTPARGEGFSIFPSSPPLLESPLNAELKKREPEHPQKKKGALKEQPLVFHSNVKSSGYSSAPRGSLLRDYPADIAAPSISRIDLSIANKPINCLQYSGDGKHILCGLGDSTVLLYNTSLAGNPTVYTGAGSGHEYPFLKNVQVIQYLPTVPSLLLQALYWKYSFCAPVMMYVMIEL